MSPNFSLLYFVSIRAAFWQLFSALSSSPEFPSISTLSYHPTYHLIHPVTLFFTAGCSVPSLLKVFIYFFFFLCCLTFSLNPFIYVFSHTKCNYILFQMVRVPISIYFCSWSHPWWIVSMYPLHFGFAPSAEVRLIWKNPAYAQGLPPERFQQPSTRHLGDIVVWAQF